MEHGHECLHHHHHEHAQHEQHVHHEHNHSIEFHAGDLCSRGLCSHIEHRGAQFEQQMRIKLEAQFAADDEDDQKSDKPKKGKKRRYGSVLAPQN